MTRGWLDVAGKESAHPRPRPAGRKTTWTACWFVSCLRRCGLARRRTSSRCGPRLRPPARPTLADRSADCRRDAPSSADATGGSWAGCRGATTSMRTVHWPRTSGTRWTAPRPAVGRTTGDSPTAKGRLGPWLPSGWRPLWHPARANDADGLRDRLTSWRTLLTLRSSERKREITQLWDALYRAWRRPNRFAMARSCWLGSGTASPGRVSDLPCSICWAIGCGSGICATRRSGSEVRRSPVGIGVRTAAPRDGGATRPLRLGARVGRPGGRSG